MKVVTADQMSELDRLAMSDYAIPGAVLMENAGRAVVDFMRERYANLGSKSVTILCGKGNNGGDGYVAARHLRLLGTQVRVIMLEPPTEGTLAAVPYKVLCKTCPEVLVPLDLTTLRPTVEASDFVVDAMLGTGLNCAPRSPYLEVLQALEALPDTVQRIAIDIPSGLDATTGQTFGAVFRAHHTVTFGYAKWGFYLQSGADCIGKVQLANIGFDWDRIPLPIPCQLSTLSTMQAVWRAVRFAGSDAHKGDFGHVGIVAGSKGMVGAPALTAKAAQRSGAGLVTVFTPQSAQPTLAAKLNEQMTVPLEEESGSLSEAAYDTLVKYAERMTVLCVGPGLTTSPATVQLVHRLLKEIPKPIILDADGLNALAQNPDVAQERAQNSRFPLIITPHPAEAARLLGTQTADVQSNRIASVQSLSAKYGAVALLKGKNTLIANPDGEILVNSTGNAGMATGGSGDTLTGIIGSLVAQAVSSGSSVPLEQVTALGAYLHGLAGDIAAQAVGRASLTAGDLIDYLPKAIRQLEGE